MTASTHPEKALQAGGAWLAMASVLMVAALGLHGPIDPDPREMMAMIADGAGRWAVAHWIAAASLSSFAVSGLILLSSRSRLTDGAWSLTGWAMITVGSLWTMTTAVAETTVMPEAAVSGLEETFSAWWAFAEGKAHGFAFVALAIALIAGRQARDPAKHTPAWAAWVAVAAGIGAFAGWALGMWLGVAIGSLLWLASSIVMCLWTLWLGAALTRAPVPEPGAVAPARATVPS